VDRIEIAPWDPEETVGRLWHAVASRLDAPAAHADAGVDLASVQGRLAIFFRALGGGAGVELRPAAREASRQRLSWRRRMSETHERVERPAFDGEALRLPARIDAFPDPALNEGLYFWLTAAAAHAPAPAPAPQADPPRADLAALAAAAMTRTTLEACPGLDEPRGAVAESRIAGLGPGFYTRLGAALRPATAGLAAGALPAPLLAAAVLVVAAAKAEIILARYLALAAAPVWLSGFRAGVRGLAVALLAVWAAPALL